MDSTLPPVAQPAWAAYQAMDVSKQRHFSYLEALEAKYEAGGYRTREEIDKLETLLSTHNDNVKAFKAAVQALAKSDLESQQKLIEHITLWNSSTNADQA